MKFVSKNRPELLCRAHHIAIFTAFLWCITLPAAAEILYFPGRAASIQQTIDLAGYGDTVVVAEGRYFENIVIRAKSVTLASAFILDGDSSHIQRTIVDGSRYTDSLRRSTISVIDCVDTAMVIKGLTITGGSGSPIFAGVTEHWSGGGILIFESSGKVEDNIIEGNHLSFRYRTNVGAGIMAAAVDDDILVIRNNLIRHNSIDTPLEAVSGGMWAGVSENGLLIAEKNRIHHNRTTCTGPFRAAGGGVRLLGMYPEKSTLIFRDNLVAYNQAIADPGGDNIKGTGGGVDIIYYDFKPVSRDRTPFLRVYGNRILNNEAYEHGGGIAITEGIQGPHKEQAVCPQVFIFDNLIKDNKAAFGVGICNWNMSFVLVNNILNNDLSIEGSTEIYNEDITFEHLNHGIINAFENQVQGTWPQGRGIVRKYPLVRSYAHLWKVTEHNPDLIQMRWVPPAWRQWWALAVYLMALVMIFWLYRRYLFYRFNLRAALDLERKEKERMRQLDEVRSRFFANISHEYRTPLTLISAPVEQVLCEAPLEEKHRQLLDYVKRNVKRLHHLTNQLLSLSKLESGSVKLEVSKGNVGSFVNSIASSFVSLAENRSIQYQVTIHSLPPNTWFDGEKIETILSNLLSNAIKFTPDGGKVELHLQVATKTGKQAGKYIRFRVTDSGRGMTEEQAGMVFDRFYSDDRLHRDDVEGTGIGLSLVRELVELYRGSIEVHSKPGSGTTFKIDLPADSSLFSKDEFSGSAESTKVPGKAMHAATTHFRAAASEIRDHGTNTGLPRVLLAEDNADLRNYISGLLSDEMDVLEAENGHQALEVAREQIPDLVISDLMMPEMDGVTLLEHLRQEEHTCHIPFFMLTARADVTSKIESFQKGTDEYIEKPFDPEELRARIRGMLNRMKELRAHFRKEIFNDPDTDISRYFEETFIARAVKYIHSELSSPGLTVSSLGDALHVSRVQLYRKIHALTGFSPSELIRTIRLKTAARLLRQSDLNITQISLEVGFGTSSYFTECFRENFGCTPSQYRQTYADQSATQQHRQKEM